MEQLPQNQTHGLQWWHWRVILKHIAQINHQKFRPHEILMSVPKKTPTQRCDVASPSDQRPINSIVGPAGTVL